MTVVWAGFTDYIQRENVIIHQPIDRVAPLLTHIDEWAKWHSDFRNQKTNSIPTKSGKEQQMKLDNVTYVLRVISPVKVYAFKVQSDDTTEAILNAVPYKDGSYTYVEYTNLQSGFSWLKDWFSNNNTEGLLLDLQSFAEDESRHYGFLIRTVKVTDTLMLTTGIVTAKDSILKAIGILHNKLISYCKQNTLLPKSYYYTSTVLLTDSRAQVSVGVPVPEQRATVVSGFEFLKLPATGRLVAGDYKGRYNDKQRLYAAMDEYVQDKHMKKVAQPLEQYQDSDVFLSDSAAITMRLYYPIF